MKVFDAAGNVIEVPDGVVNDLTKAPVAENLDAANIYILASIPAPNGMRRVVLCPPSLFAKTSAPMAVDIVYGGGIALGATLRSIPVNVPGVLPGDTLLVDTPTPLPAGYGLFGATPLAVPTGGNNVDVRIFTPALGLNVGFSIAGRFRILKAG